MLGEALGVVVGMDPPGAVESEPPLGGVIVGSLEGVEPEPPPGGVMVGVLEGVLWAKELGIVLNPVKAIELITRDAIKDFFMTKMSSDIRKQQGLVN